jgi:hypothetical protein
MASPCILPMRGTAPRMVSDRLLVSAYGLGRTNLSDCAACLKLPSLRYARAILPRPMFQALVIELVRVKRLDVYVALRLVA